MKTHDDGFTFITVTYNHELYIIEHLNSIKDIIAGFGKGRIIDLIISDDCSKDKTVVLALEWLESNRQYFRNVKTLVSDHNCGIIRNLNKAINEVDTSDFKFLAGDDKYERYRALLLASKTNHVKQLQKYDNFIQAPGVFYRGYIFQDSGFWNYLMSYRNIEDIPMWQYFLFCKNFNIKVLNTPYIRYRLNSGVSTSKMHDLSSTYNEELFRIRKELKIKRHDSYKYLNVYRYIAQINRLLLYAQKEKINQWIGNDPLLEMYKI